MGIDASYRRVSHAEWAEIQKRLAEGEEAFHGSDLEEAFLELRESDAMMNSDRYPSIDKEFHALHALLTGDLSDPSEMKPSPPPLGNVVMGGAETPFPATYGMVRWLTPGEVRDVADALAAITADDLKSRFDPDAFNRAGIYPRPRPGGWDADELEPLLFTYPLLVDFFKEAARAGDVVLLSLD